MVAHRLFDKMPGCLVKSVAQILCCPFTRFNFTYLSFQFLSCWEIAFAHKEGRKMVFGQVVVGPPGSGKTTYCNGMSQFLSLIGR